MCKVENHPRKIEEMLAEDQNMKPPEPILTAEEKEKLKQRPRTCAAANWGPMGGWSNLNKGR